MGDVTPFNLPAPALDDPSSTTGAFSFAAPAPAPAWQTFAANFSIPKSPYRRQIGPLEWEALKPTVERMFIVEGKTYNDIAEYLRKNHNFNPSKRQFEGKTTRWGFRKNTRKADRQIILSNLGEGDGVIEGGRATVKLTRQKLKRWEKEKEAQNRRSDTPNSEASAEALLLLSDVSTLGQSPGSCEGNRMGSLDGKEPSRTVSPGLLETGESALDRNPTTSSIPISPNFSASISHEQAPEADQRDIAPGRVRQCQDLEYQTLWDAANICNSPKLTSLMDAIEIDKQHPLPDPVITVPEVHTRPYEFLSTWDLRSLYTAPDECQNASSGMMIARNRITKSRSLDPEREQYVDFVLKSWLDSVTKQFPFNELSPFPKSKRRNKVIVPIFKPSSPISQQIVTCRSQLHKLERASSKGNAGVILAAKRLAELCYEGGKHKEAEALFVRVAIAKQKTLGAQHPETVTEYLNIIDAHADGGDNPGAATMLESIHGEITRLFDPGCLLALRSLDMMRTLLSNASDFTKANRLGRQQLQLSLRNYGMLHITTAQAMFGLAVMTGIAASWSVKSPHSSSHDEELASSKMLMQHCFDIEAELGTQAESTRLYRMSYLSRIYLQTGDFQESIRMDREVIRKSRDLYGCTHPSIQRNLRQLVKSFRCAGRLEESEAAAEYLIRLSISSPGWEEKERLNLRETTLSALIQLATTLESMERWVEAAVRYEDVYGHYGERCAERSHLEHQSEHIKTSLIKCYRMQGLYTEPGAFGKRLMWIFNSAVLKKFQQEKKSRKWHIFESDMYPGEIEAPPRKKARMMLIVPEPRISSTT